MRVLVCGVKRMYRIAVIEDTPAEILLLRIALDRAELAYELVEFSAGESAIASLAACESLPDLIITDAILPRMSLNELLSGLKEIELVRKVPVIVLSGMDDPELTRAALANGAADYIVKPSDLPGWIAVGHRLKHRLAT